VKSENILMFRTTTPPAAAAANGPLAGLCQSGWLLKLADFGVACQTSTLQPRAGTVVGTPEFLSVEQIQGFEYTKATNTYAVSEASIRVFFTSIPVSVLLCSPALAAQTGVPACFISSRVE